MIIDDTCTGGCSFCNVRTDQPRSLDANEPGRVPDAVAQLSLRHVVITSVDRDDLKDGAAADFAAVIHPIPAAAPPPQSRGTISSLWLNRSGRASAYRLSRIRLAQEVWRQHLNHTV
jgi:lipoate synthase